MGEQKAVSFTVHGSCYSLKNSHILSTRSGKIRSIKPAACRKFEEDFMMQVPAEYRDLGLGGPGALIRSCVTVFYPSWRQDLDCAVIYDLLQKSGIISNDRWIREKHEFAQVDLARPRVDISLEDI